jgi:hypothetical protein
MPLRERVQPKPQGLFKCVALISSSFSSTEHTSNTETSQCQTLSLDNGYPNLVLVLKSMGNPSVGSSVSLGRHATVFQAEIYAILACASEIQTNVRSGKYISICCDSQAALKALQAAKHPHWYGSAKGR